MWLAAGPGAGLGVHGGAGEGDGVGAPQASYLGEERV